MAMLQTPAIQAVLLAGGGGSRLYPLNAAGTPKVLLPVANRPLLTFPLRMLEESGVADVLVVRGCRLWLPCCCLCHCAAAAPVRAPALQHTSSMCAPSTPGQGRPC